MRVLVTGKNGQLGRSIQDLVTSADQADDYIFSGREELDLSDRDSITRYFDTNGKFDVIVNCAAYTAVDRAEEEQDLANQINHLAVKQIAKIAVKYKAQLVHVSTDYVFDGNSEHSYMETDATNPINIYGETKLAGENSIQEVMPLNAIIIRTSWVYSEYGNNFVKTMLRLGRERNEISVVSDQVGSPTYATDLAEAILVIINDKNFRHREALTGIYHYSNDGEISWFDFAREVFKIAEIECNVKPVSTEQYPTPATRPKNTVMNKDKIISNLNVPIFSWHDSLRTCLYRLTRND